MVLSNVPSRSNITSFLLTFSLCLSYIDYLLVAKVEIKNELDAVRLHHVGTTVNYACSE